ncbi:MAG: HlyC/CorC family transporter [Deltaproteobacteria bacterium]|jgi:CBS domain containing-hemolysin-like protein|nr:HlyC/CorC family transporter [Deltaproteobacteria bacterium]MBW2478837.1 HlyC/CorC family transporter [Deltaproteobacteria bacterium]
MLFDQLVVLIVLLLLSGFFSSAETALFSISRAKARHIAKERGLTNTLIKRMKDDPHRLLSTILIGNNLVNVAAAALATSVTIELVASNAVGIATGIMTALILIFGEIIPKSVATRNNILIAKLVILPLHWLSILFSPIIFLLNFIPRLTRKVQRKSRVTEEELMTFVEVVEEEGGIEEEEKELIHNIFEFDDTSASEIMTPRADMFVINVDEELDVEAIIRSGFSRIPVIEEDIDHVIGILNIKDLFMHQVTSAKEIEVRQVMSEPYFVPENKKLDHLLQEFKRRKQHLAIVVDEHGGVSGLITLEDALEEIVGEIIDETDKVEPHIVKLKKNEWRVLGKTEIDDVNDKLAMQIPDTKEYDTFSGYILDQIGRIPREKEDIELGNFIVTVNQMDGTRIKEYIVKKTEAIPQEADQTS